MKPSSRIIGMSVAFILCTVLLHGQDADSNSTKKKNNTAYIMVGASIGNFLNGGGSHFEEIYSNRSVMRNYSAGIGSRGMLLIAKYHEFSASGKSILVNVAVEGKAEWKQKFYAAGFRIRSDEHPLYVDLLYVVTRAEESITTVAPQVNELTATESTENKGMGAAIGLSFKLAGMLGLFAEAEYSTMTRLGRNQYGRANPELGGLDFNAGLQLSL